MITRLAKNFKGIYIITGPTKSGKSQLAEFLVAEQESITYIATSQPRQNDPEWQKRIEIHSNRRPHSWKLIEYPLDICEVIESLHKNESILIDSLGGLVEQQILQNNTQWDLFQNNFISCLMKCDLGIIIVSEEIGWGIVPSTPIGHLFRERHTSISSKISCQATKKWLAVNGTAIDLDKIGDVIP